MKYLFLIVFLSTCSLSFAQSGSAFGLRAGLNYGSSGDLIESVDAAAENPESNIGYHAGLFAKVDLGPLYIRPELLYTRVFSDYTETRLDMQKIEAPLLLGVNVAGPVNIFAGPSLQFILDTELEPLGGGGEALDFEEIQDRFTIGAQFGVSVYFSNLEIGLRYDRSLNENVAEFAANNGIDNIRVDSRTEQVILALSLQL